MKWGLFRKEKPVLTRKEQREELIRELRALAIADAEEQRQRAFQKREPNARTADHINQALQDGILDNKPAS